LIIDGSNDMIVSFVQMSWTGLPETWMNEVAILKQEMQDKLIEHPTISYGKKVGLPKIKKLGNWKTKWVSLKDY